MFQIQLARIEYTLHNYLYFKLIAYSGVVGNLLVGLFRDIGENFLPA